MLDNSQVMKLYSGLFVLALVATTWCSAIPKPDEANKNRVYDKKLSEKTHEEEGEHNTDYDHEAILGHEDAQAFDKLSPEESRDRLGIIVDKMDKDKDGSVTEDELREWIKYVQNKYVVKNTEERWKEFESEGQIDQLKWENFKKRTFGFQEEDIEPQDEKYVYKEMIVRDKRRWEKADLNGDHLLSKEEFRHFLHPEEADHMKDVVVMETLEDIDKDKDGFVSLEEYIADIYGNDDEDEDEDDEDDDDEKDTEWVAKEKEQFLNFRDKNKDGRLDKNEVMDWIIPEERDHSDTESVHLVKSADADKDGKLSKQEILDKYDLFVGSQATDFGEALTQHDEF